MAIKDALLDKVSPMLHVPDVQAAADWYKSIGFTVENTFSDGSEVVFALVSAGATQLMFSSGGKPSDQFRREVDLYVYSSGVDELYDRLKGRVEVVEDLHDTFYGMREFIIRDLNRFWITFGQPIQGGQGG